MTVTSRHTDLPRGFSDADSTRTAALRRVEHRWFEKCALAGFRAVEVPPVGFADTFTTGHYASGDRIYRFPDRRGRELALVSDSLPALLRFAGTHRLPEQRLSYRCPVFRYERKPRRYFHHLGLMELTRPTIEQANQISALRRLISTVTAFLPSSLAADFTISNPAIWFDLVRMFVRPEQVGDYVDRLRRVPVDERQAMLVADNAPPAAVAVADLLAQRRPHDDTTTVPEPIRSGIDCARQLVEQLRRQRIRADTDLNELHASEFHDGLAFVVRHNGVVLGDGGNYSSFASKFLGFPTSAYAAVTGLERITDLTDSSAEPVRAADLAILSFPDHLSTEHAHHLVANLRGRGIAVWDCELTLPLRRHLRDFADLNIPLSVLIGPEEIKSAEYRVRDRSGEVCRVPHDELADWIMDWNRSSQASAARQARGDIRL
ncbi:ATP phosphoribosyltransferase regulatory subunit [Nocardia puris]|uniref:histidine--tRNA ligase n=1 Tax=Nocardia puris TaxID=208602 RepID=A0A366D6X9_9NOCA|nr:ATP phosphoribosyltransferase regulatory subunit [Nocardia puris]MBF6216211.1 ATP phosphoribosyltransferase regulatory subunit [Nocardia puris]RBO85249.1 histidyl-tRNA synthetase [Nocardia puris]